MTKYAESPAWSDIDPIAQDDGPGHPLAAIAYTDAYSEAMSYLRAVMAKNEMSERVLALTEDIIGMNPAHYTVWLYRARVLFHLSLPLRTEIQWLNHTSLKHQKNYQIWHHRQTIIDRLNDSTGEQEFVTEMFALDSKNYHVWSYRQWLVKRFALWDEGELEACETLLKMDVRNNSAWNHRWFVVFGRDEGNAVLRDESVVQREAEYAKSQIRLAPQNQSPWNYLQGLARQASGSAAISHSSLKDFASEFASLDDPDNVRSSHALDMLADILAKEEGKSAEAATALDLLASKYDPIRENYWKYRKTLLPRGIVDAAG
ncbi:protein prenylyltransferase [Venturia nashicola]|uniref:Protein farnesyltransferase/geranylgeranyltransferase type-1 subunit alpha n=1 Tax=Venturia nashicola TaxID=86259 RepID=A0A4Z1PVC3_9PEZI|nr:protein prenylyltransferase [Venturia nashicola]TLD39142.1 protein prenylyltransferase [Venturia nashicola]